MKVFLTLRGIEVRVAFVCSFYPREETRESISSSVGNRPDAFLE